MQHRTAANHGRKPVVSNQSQHRPIETHLSSHPAPDEGGTAVDQICDDHNRFAVQRTGMGGNKCECGEKIPALVPETPHINRLARKLALGE